MYAITNNILLDNPNANITYIKGEDFTNKLVEAINKKQQEQFRNKYRKGGCAADRRRSVHRGQGILRRRSFSTRSIPSTRSISRSYSPPTVRRRISPDLRTEYGAASRAEFSRTYRSRITSCVLRSSKIRRRASDLSFRTRSRNSSRKSSIRTSDRSRE